MQFNLWRYGVAALLVAGFCLLFPHGAQAICGHATIECWGKNPDTGEHNVKVGELPVGACHSARNMSCTPAIL